MSVLLPTTENPLFDEELSSDELLASILNLNSGFTIEQILTVLNHFLPQKVKFVYSNSGNILNLF